MGRYRSHPGAVEVYASEGHISLSGSILAHEYRDFLQCVRGGRGVKEVNEQLVVHKSADGVSEFEGGQRRAGERMGLLQDNWSPGTRLVTGSTATLLALYA